MDSSTIDPSVSQEVAATAEKLGALFVDSPVSGGKKNLNLLYFSMNIVYFICHLYLNVTFMFNITDKYLGELKVLQYFGTYFFLWDIYHVTDAVHAVIGPCCDLFYCVSWCTDMCIAVWDLKTAQINMQHILIQVLILDEF